MLTPTRLWSLEFLWTLEWLGNHATKIFKNLDDKNEYDETTLILALHLSSFYRFFVDTNFRNFFTLSIILRICRKLRQVPDHIECPSCVAYPINSDIRSCGRVPDHFGKRPKPDPTIGYSNLSGTRSLLIFVIKRVNYRLDTPCVEIVNVIGFVKYLRQIFKFDEIPNSDTSKFDKISKIEISK